VTSLNKAGPYRIVYTYWRYYAWGLGGVDPNTTIAIYFDVSNTVTRPEGAAKAAVL
jgi:hypothetical protein